MPTTQKEKNSDSFRSVSSHVEDLASGRTLAPGEFVDLTKEEQKDPHNARLLEEGILISTDATEEGSN